MESNAAEPAADGEKISDILSAIDKGKDAIIGSLSNVFGGDESCISNEWAKTAAVDGTQTCNETSEKKAPSSIGVGAAGTYVSTHNSSKNGSQATFAYHELNQNNSMPEAHQNDSLQANSDGYGSKITQTLLANTFFMAKGKSAEELFHLKGKGAWYTSPHDWQEKILEVLHGEFIRVCTLDGRSLDCIWVPPGGASTKVIPRAAVVFHPNFAIALDMVQYGCWYRDRGFGVLLVTMGGYAGSEGDTTELSTYLDAHAAVQYVLCVRGVTLPQILCHGVSIGGALASAAACIHPGVHCTVDQTFINAREVAENLIESLPGWKRHTPKWMIATFITAVFPEGQADPRLAGLSTDGYDNEAKAAAVQGHYFVIWADNDHMMPANFATRLAKAHQTSVLEQCRSALSRKNDPTDCKDNANATEEATLRMWLSKLGWLTEEDHALCGEELRGKLAAVSSKYEYSLLDDLVVSRMACIRGGCHGSFFAEDPCCEALYLKYLQQIGLLLPVK